MFMTTIIILIWEKDNYMSNSIKGLVFFILILSCNSISKSRNDDVRFIENKIPNILDGSVISNVSRNESKLSKFKVNDSVVFYKVLKNTFNFYDIYYYARVNKNTFVIYYSYDYSKTLLLLTFIDNMVTDYHELAYISGDGGDFDFKKSIYKNGIFFSSFAGGERTFTSPNDTISYRYRGTSKIYITKNGDIVEDTIQVEKDFFEVKPEGYNIDSNY